MEHPELGRIFGGVPVQVLNLWDCPELVDRLGVVSTSIVDPAHPPLWDVGLILEVPTPNMLDANSESLHSNRWTAADYHARAGAELPHPSEILAATGGRADGTTGVGVNEALALGRTNAGAVRVGGLYETRDREGVIADWAESWLAETGTRLSVPTCQFDIGAVAPDAFTVRGVGRATAVYQGFDVEIEDPMANPAAWVLTKRRDGYLNRLRPDRRTCEAILAAGPRSPRWRHTARRHWAVADALRRAVHLDRAADDGVGALRFHAGYGRAELGYELSLGYYGGWATPTDARNRAEARVNLPAYFPPLESLRRAVPRQEMVRVLRSALAKTQEVASGGLGLDGADAMPELARRAIWRNYSDDSGEGRRTGISRPPRLG